MKELKRSRDQTFDRLVALNRTREAEMNQKLDRVMELANKLKSSGRGSPPPDRLEKLL